MSARVHDWMLRAASLLTPAAERADWLKQWRSELFYVSRRRATAFCLGAFRDAVWVRRNTSAGQRGVHLQSAWSCLAFLAAGAGFSFLMAVLLGAPLRAKAMFSHMGVLDVFRGCGLTFALSFLLLPGARLALHGGRQAVPRKGRLRRALFLLAKVVLVQPILVFGMVSCVLLAPLAPFAPYLLCVSCILVLRWVFEDQQRRCPVCLRVLTEPVRMGSASRTLLDWYGAESMCARGHGLLYAPDECASYCSSERWLKLDSSWGDLFAETAGMRR